VRSETISLLRGIAALVSIALATGGCAGLPSVSGVTGMSLGVGAVPQTGPQVAVSGESDAGPGKAAIAVLPPAEACQDLMVLACAVYIPVAVPIAAVFGAFVKTTQKLPTEQAVALNQATTLVANQQNLAASFRSALEAEGRRRGIALGTTSSDARVVVSLQSFAWNIKAGNRVALRMDLEVTVRVGDEDGSRNVTYRSRSASVDDWTANNGEPIRGMLRDAMTGAGEAVWNRVLGPERNRGPSQP